MQAAATVPSFKPNAHSLQVTSKEQAETYPVNQNLEDMFFVCNDTIYVKTFDLGKGKWNDMRIYKLESAVNETTQDIDNKYETLKKFVMQEISELKAELQQAKQMIDEIDEQEKVVEDDDEDEEYEDEIVETSKPTTRKVTNKSTIKKSNTSAKTSSKSGAKTQIKTQTKTR
jgi:hypothetical protein